MTTAVLMIAVPDRTRRPAVRGNLAYVNCTAKSWRSWCKLHGFSFALVENGGALPPQADRWRIARNMFDYYYERVLVVDADTIVKWNAPDIFAEFPTDIGAVRNGDDIWSRYTVDTYEHYWPDVAVDLTTFFNSGVVALRRGAWKTLDAFVKTFEAHKDDIRAAVAELSWDPGVDQAMLNLAVAATKPTVTMLAPRWNLLLDQVPTPAEYVDGYVWHFARTPDKVDVIKYAWEGIKHNYSRERP